MLEYPIKSPLIITGDAFYSAEDSRASQSMLIPLSLKTIKAKCLDIYQMLCINLSIQEIITTD